MKKILEKIVSSLPFFPRFSHMFTAHRGRVSATVRLPNVMRQTRRQPCWNPLVSSPDFVISLSLKNNITTRKTRETWIDFNEIRLIHAVRSFFCRYVRRHCTKTRTAYPTCAIWETRRFSTMADALRWSRKTKHGAIITEMSKIFN